MQFKDKYSNEWDSADLFTKWTFRVANDMLKQGELSPLEYTQITRLPHGNRVEIITKVLEAHYAQSKPIWYLPRLMVAIFASYKSLVIVIHVWSILESVTRIAAPVVLGLLLKALQSGSANTAYGWGGLLAGLNLAQAIIHHILFYYNMNLGWCWKAGASAMIFNKLFKAKLSAHRSTGNKKQQVSKNSAETIPSPGTTGSGAGNLVNLISNDVARFEIFSVFLPFALISMLDVAAILVILVFYLNVYAAIAAVGTSFMCIPLQAVLAKQFGRLRTSTGAATDQRVRLISQAITGATTVKSNGWEVPLFSMISAFRQTETTLIDIAQNLRAVNLAVYFFIPSISTFAAFSVYVTSETGNTLTLPLVFSVMSLLLQLRTSIGWQWTKAIETLSEACSSAIRIERFLDLPDDDGADDELPAYANEDLRANPNPANEIFPFVSDDIENELDVEKKQEETCVPTRFINDTHGVPSPVALLSPCLVRISKSSYAYTNDESGDIRPVLKDVEVELSRGQLVMVVGAVGAGKSSFLAALLGELLAVGSGDDIHCRYVAPGTRFAYCVQQPWIIAGSVKSNIVMASRRDKKSLNSALDLPNDDVNTAESSTALDSYKLPPHIDESLYSLALSTASLRSDLSLWPHGDSTEIGERGISVSGGQKARIALARAVYSDADVVVLDDVLSAVDSEVGRHIFFDCVLGAMRDRGKAVALATHQLQYLVHADTVIVLDKDGRMAFSGTYTELQQCAQDRLSADLNALLSSATSSSLLPSASSNSVDQITTPLLHRLDPTIAISSNDDNADRKGPFSLIRPSTAKEDGSFRPVIFEPTPMPDARNAAAQGESESEAVSGHSKSSATAKQMYGVQQEDQMEGIISAAVVAKYLVSGGVWRGVLAVGALLVSLGISMITDYWLQWWAVSAFGDQSSLRYVWIYAILTTACVVLGYLRAWLWFRFTIQASRSLHERALWAVLHAPLSFFHANPTGRILNRFTRDLGQVDELLPQTIFDCLAIFAFCIGTLVLICVVIPYLLLLMPPILAMFIYVRTRYVKSSRELKRLEAVSRSPIYADFSATLDGLSTLKAYGLRRVCTESFHRQIDRNSRVWYAFLMVSRWLGFRLDMESALVLVVVVFVAISLRTSIDVGLLGFTLTYTMALSGLLQWAARQSAEVENMLTGVERLSTYAALPCEQGYSSTLTGYKGGAAPHSHSFIHSHRGGLEKGGDIIDMESLTTDGFIPVPSIDTRDKGIPTTHVATSPSVLRGELRVTDLVVSYREDMPPVLDGINLHVCAGCKVGVCGRTGSGKSSLLLALLRLNVIQRGDIQIDGQSILQLDLESARHLVTCIPQTPDIFSGTLRFNLDPFGEYTDVQLWQALRDAHIHEYVMQDPRGLDAIVEEGGKNFSVGQRQLLSLARAILRHSPLVLLDEATANIDYATDRLIQKTVRQSPSFVNSTVVTIAHRLRTIADCDLIVVIREGRAAEVGKPHELLDRDQSLFRALALESNEFEEIKTLAMSKLITNNDR